MSKNKFIKCLKIFAVFFPLVFGFVAKPLALFALSNGFSTEYLEDGVNNLYMINLEDNARIEVDTICKDIFQPYINVILINSQTNIPIAYNLADFTLNTFFNASFTDVNSIMESNPTVVTPIACLIVLIWYIFVELIFFIPEVILLFIRWCKNLMYSFTRKGGFDA